MIEESKYDKASLQRNIKEWSYTYDQHLQFCHEYFGGRADIVVEYSRKLKEDTELGSIQMLDLCMQIEAEFPKQLEQIYEEANRHPNGMLVGIGQYIRHLRQRGANQN